MAYNVYAQIHNWLPAALNPGTPNLDFGSVVNRPLQAIPPNAYGSFQVLSNACKRIIFINSSKVKSNLWKTPAEGSRGFVLYTVKLPDVEEEVTIKFHFNVNSQNESSASVETSQPAVVGHRVGGINPTDHPLFCIWHLPLLPQVL